MARIRSIHPDACDSEKLSMLSDSAERTFFRLLTHADDDGRGEDRPKLLAAKLYPLHDDKDAGTVDADLDEILRVGLLVRYRVNAKPYFAIPTFKDWQKPRHPTASKLPPPEEADPEDDDNPTAERGTPTAERGNATDNRDEPPHGEGVGGGEGESHAGAAGAATGDSLKLIHPEPEDDGFEDFWDEYPRHHKSRLKGGGGDKQKTHKQWRRLSKSQRAEAMEALKGYQRVCQDQYPKHAERFLTGEAWKTFLDVPEDASDQDVAALLGDRGFA